MSKESIVPSPSVSDANSFESSIPSLSSSSSQLSETPSPSLSGLPDATESQGFASN